VSSLVLGQNLLPFSSALFKSLIFKRERRVAISYSQGKREGTANIIDWRICEFAPRLWTW
jgi:hypothetical protein